jgi:electron transfer flavoprotein beta subunit
MPLHLIVMAKQVIDPDMPLAAFRIDTAGAQVTTPASFPPVVNGFDEYAMEAALRVKDAQETQITAVSVGKQFDLNIMRKLLAMGADNLILCQDPAFANLPDSLVVARVLGRHTQNWRL